MRTPGRLLLAAAAMLAAGCAQPGPAAPPSGAQHGPSGSGAPVPGVSRSQASPPATSASSGGSGAAAGVPRPAHTVVVVMENHSFSEIIGSPQAPFINRLARQGALLTASYAVTHPSEPNYLALFSGSTQGVSGDPCPVTFAAPNLATALTRAGLTFAGYAEGLPATGSPACQNGGYARKHAPWADFSNVPAADSRPLTSFPANYARLPAVSFVSPDLCHDMHDCPVGTGDSWLAAHLAGYARWAMTHASLLILTWDEDDGSSGDHIATVFAGQYVRPGRYGQRVTHYGVLRTIEAAYRLRPVGLSAAAAPLTAIWLPARS